MEKKNTFCVTIELDEDNTIDDDNFRDLRSIFRFLNEEQCRRAMRVLILGQPTESAEMALFARIADWIAFGAKYSDMPRKEAVEKFKESLTDDNLRDAWNKCEL